MVIGFVFVLIVAFAGMLYKVATFNPDAIFDADVASEIERQEWYINHNPFYYGLTATMGNNTLTQGLIKYAKQ